MQDHCEGPSDDPVSGLAVDDAEAWDRACTLDQRPEGNRLGVLALVFSPALVGLLVYLQPGLRVEILVLLCLVVGSAVLHLVSLRSAETPGQVKRANLRMHLGVLVAGSFAAAVTPYLSFFTALLMVSVFGPLGAYTWPRLLSVVAFGAVPVVFVGAHLVLPHNHPIGEVAQSTFLLALGAALGLVLMDRKYAVQFDAFRSRRELGRAHQELAESVQRLVRAQGNLVRSEKLAVLGQLVAGVAHELNTPLGAISASAETLSRGLPDAVQDLPVVLAKCDPVARQGFRHLLGRAVAAAAQAGSLTSREERALRRRLTQELDEAGVPGAADHASVLAELGISEDMAPLLPLLKLPDAADLVPRVDTLASLLRSASTIQIAAGRASKIVQALKRYAHPGDQSGAAVQASLPESIDTVLILYASYIKRGVRLVRQFDDPGVVSAHHDALNQVWTNLVHNALQALDGGGTLTVRVRDAGTDRVRVEVEDDGPGIPPEHLARIFEPFFTTKASGEGSGLGLSICQDIVVQHGGVLGVTSTPGCTVFSVTLPRGVPAGAELAGPSLVQA